MALMGEGSAPEDTAISMASAKRRLSIQEIKVDLSAPEPPSKRARRALKKGKAISKKAAEEDDVEVDDGSGGKGDERQGKERRRSQHGIWIGNLPFTVTAISLRKWLVENSGEAITDDSITRIKLPTVKEPGRDKSRPTANKGFAYVDFVEVGPKVAAMALSETGFGGRQVLIKDAQSFEGRPSNHEAAKEVVDGRSSAKQADAGKDASASRKLFVGNMGFKTTEDDVRRNFEKCGEIEWAKMATFEDTGKCKGYGWVKFKEAEAAAWAVKGFVKIKEEVEHEVDFRSDGDEDGENSGGEAKQFKTRKWWVNRLQGRQLKLELAEDDQTRYKKRFGKDAAKRESGSKPVREGTQSVPETAGKTGERQARGSWKKTGRPLAEDVDLQTARMTGKVVKHTGTKVTFA